MDQLITYSDDTAALLDEVPQEYLITDEETGNRSIGPLTKTPTKRNGSETLAVVRHLPQEFLSLEHLKVIGEITQAGGDYQRVMGFGDLSETEANALYDRIYPRQVMEYEDDGVKYTSTPPDLFGVIA